MALEACVREILCGLSAATLGAVSSIINAQRAILQAQVAALQAELLVLDVATLPLQVAREAALTALNTARSAITIVPLDLIAGCADLGDFNIGIDASLNAATGAVVDIIDDLNRLLSFREELNLLISEFNATIDLFDEVLLVIQECA